jgi:hypothetical protein
MSGRIATDLASQYASLRRSRDPRRRLLLATQLLDALTDLQQAVSSMRDESVSSLRKAGASHAEIAQAAGINRSRAAQLAQRTNGRRSAR